MIGVRLPDSDLETLGRGHCVVCGYRGFILGPRGGVAQNIECGNLQCRARWNVVTFGGEVLMAEVIERENEGGASWGKRDGDAPQHGGTIS